MGKTVRICKAERLSNLSDFLSARYGQSRLLGGLVAGFLTISVVPYIALQIKATAAIYSILRGSEPAVAEGLLTDEAFWLTLCLALFVVLYGVRRLDPNERHAGIVAAISFEAVFKLVAFLTAGVYIIFILYDGLGDVFGRMTQVPGMGVEQWTVGGTSLSWYDWIWLTLISASAVLLLPRQFHVAVVEVADEAHISKGAWQFPLYLILINLFVIPIAAAGLVTFSGGGESPDYLILQLPQLAGAYWLVALVGLGGFAAATGMVVVSTIALSLMITNGIIVPLGLRLTGTDLRGRRDLQRLLLNIRRVVILVVLLLAYAYYHLLSAEVSLVSIGLISFAAVAQFTPAFIGALYLKWVNRDGVIAGLVWGFTWWGITLALPTLASYSPLIQSWLTDGLMGVPWLRIDNLFNLDMHPVVNGASWSLLINCFGILFISKISASRPVELSQAALFVDFDQQSLTGAARAARRRNAQIQDIQKLLTRFVGATTARLTIERYAPGPRKQAPPELIVAAERQLAGLVGSASAATLMRGVVREEPIPLDEVVAILRRTSETVRYNQLLERQKEELQALTEELRMANQRLRALDALKAEFIATITHELRTPVTSIKSLAAIVQEDTEMDEQQRGAFLKIIVNESERLGRLVQQVLDAESLDQPKTKGAAGSKVVAPVNIIDLLQETLDGLMVLVEQREADLSVSSSPMPLYVRIPADRFRQIVVNLVGNALKFIPADGSGRIAVTLRESTLSEGVVELVIQDNGPGVPKDQAEFIFDQFAQVHDRERGKPDGSGLGLFISRKIAEQSGGSLRLDQDYLEGAAFILRLPAASTTSISDPQ